LLLPALEFDEPLVKVVFGERVAGQIPALARVMARRSSSVGTFGL
jgi:hypothetical protein